MKIHYSNHDVVQVDQNDSKKHIPLSYTSTPTNNEIEISMNALQPFHKDKVQVIKPYDIINGFDTLVFNEDMTIEDNNKILRDIGNNNFYYIPTVLKKERPTIFGYQILYKSNKRYTQQEKYDIQVGFVDNSKNAMRSKELIAIFGDSNIRGISANNVIINSGDMSPASLINREMIDNDILFIETDDGEHYKGTKIKIDYENFKKNKVNLWLIVGKNFNNEYGELIKSNDSKSKINTNLFFNKVEYHSDYEIQLYKNNIKEISGDNSIILTQNLNSNYVVITGDDFFKNIHKNSKAIHELLLYIYINRYYISDHKKTWVHNFVPDYKVENYKLVKIDKFYEKIKNIKGFEPIKAIHNDMIVKSNVKNGKVFFNYDVVPYNSKDHNNITICNDNLEIIHTNVQNKHYLISKKIDILNYKYKQNILEIELSPIINSKKGINISNSYKHKEEIDIRIIQERTLYCDIVNNQIVMSSKLSDRTVAIILVSIYNENETEVYDLRIKGGGLPEKEDNNYNLLDIGSSYGRPARKAGSMIITLPPRLKKYKQYILQYINDNKIADRHVILLFEERS